VRAYLRNYYGRVGAWWNRKGDEIDVVALSEDEILFGEVKWRNRKIGCNVIESLIEKSELIGGEVPKKRKYLVVSKS